MLEINNIRKEAEAELRVELTSKVKEKIKGKLRELERAKAAVALLEAQIKEIEANAALDIED